MTLAGIDTTPPITAPIALPTFSPTKLKAFWKNPTFFS
jgi:hypothetical protein